MKTKIAIVAVIILLGSVASGVTFADEGDKSSMNNAVSETVIVEADNLEHRDYRIKYSLMIQEGDEVDKRIISTHLVENSQLQFYTEQHRIEPSELYGNQVVRWAKTSDEWWMTTHEPGPIDPFRSAHLTADDLTVESKNESTATIRIDDREKVRKFVSGSPHGWAPDTQESWVRIDFDMEERRIAQIVHHTTHEDGRESRAIYKFSSYGSVSVERPDDVPFSLHEQIRLLLYRVGLL